MGTRSFLLRSISLFLLFLVLCPSYSCAEPDPGIGDTIRDWAAPYVEGAKNLGRRIYHAFKAKATSFLQKFGYMRSSNPESEYTPSEDTFKKSILTFQRFYKLEQTGEIDEPTKNMMETPRCAVPDNIPPEYDGSNLQHHRQKRYVVLSGYKWKRRDLKWRINKYTQKLDKTIVDGAFTKAFAAWSEVSPFDITYKPDGQVHLDIQFKPQDGPGGTLAYAHPPGPGAGGDMRFDELEQWTVRTADGTNLYQVAIHEIGHTLGLDHSDSRDSVMFPAYTGYVRGIKLSSDDIAGIQTIYGSKAAPKTQAEVEASGGRSTSVKLGRNSGGSVFGGSTGGKIAGGLINILGKLFNPFGAVRRQQMQMIYNGDACSASNNHMLDGITITQDGSTYAFKGEYYFQLKDEQQNSQVGPGPRLIRQDWQGLPSSIDAVVTGPDGRTYFFKENQCWEFVNKQPSPGYPQPISRKFPGVPDNLDAVFLWGHNQKFYFIKGNQYWKFHPGTNTPVSSRYPRPLSNFKHVPDKLDAAVLWRDGHVYFFSGKYYYKFDDDRFEVAEGFPKSIASWWFSCEHEDDADPVGEGAKDPSLQ